MTGGRALTDDEAAVLAVLLSADFPGAPALRDQATVVRASPGCTCGCGTIDLHVPEGSALAVVVERVPVEATVTGSDGKPAGLLLLFVDDGLLSSIEVASLDDEPLAVPAAERVTDVTAASGSPDGPRAGEGFPG